MAVYANFAELLLTEPALKDGDQETPIRQEEDYGCRFLSPPPSDLICRVCHVVLRDPRQTLCCGGHYCSYCLQMQFKVNRECAFCSSRQVRSFRDVSVTRRVNKLGVECPHRDRGCEWSGELQELGDHLASCTETPRACRTCGEVLSKELVEKHEATLCPKRTFRCPHCEKYVATYESVRDAHWPRCLQYPIPCPNQCSKGSVPRKDMLKHLRHACSLKKRYADMTAVLDRAQTELKEKNSEIEQLKLKVATDSTRFSNGLSLDDDDDDKVKLIERVTEMQRQRAEDDHEKFCLRQDVETRERRIVELETQNSNLRRNLGHMEQDMNTQLQAMKTLCEGLREEKEAAEKRLKPCTQSHNNACSHSNS